jgi:hypothetical protein
MIVRFKVILVVTVKVYKRLSYKAKKMVFFKNVWTYQLGF